MQPCEVCQEVQAPNSTAIGELDAATYDADPGVLVHAGDEPVEPAFVDENVVLQSGEIFSPSDRERQTQAAGQSQIHARVNDPRAGGDGIDPRGRACPAVVDDDDLERNGGLRGRDTLQALLERIDPLPGD